MSTLTILRHHIYENAEIQAAYIKPILCSNVVNIEAKCDIKSYSILRFQKLKSYYRYFMSLTCSKAVQRSHVRVIRNKDKYGIRIIHLLGFCDVLGVVVCFFFIICFVAVVFTLSCVLYPMFHVSCVPLDNPFLTPFGFLSRLFNNLNITI